ncbi:MAG: HIT domain-containing protein [Brevinemataceae bacterium]
MGNCIFCRIADRSLPADIVYENDFILAFHDINPLAKIHIVVIPKECRIFFHETSDGTLLKLLSAIKVIVKQQGLEENGYRLINNNGTNGGQSVPHIHFHILSGEQLGHNLSGK